MITINLSEKQAAELKEAMSIKNIRYGQFERPEVMIEVIKQINNQQFDVSDFESSRQYEVLSVNAAYLENWDRATEK
ncbi:TPA: hypothetical protein J2F85_003422 [Escherichia coli]|nr:hypothetical protein [Escherichia coli]